MANSKDITRKFLDEAFAIRDLDSDISSLLPHMSNSENSLYVNNILEEGIKKRVKAISEKYADLESPEKEYLEGLKKFYGLVMENKQANYKEIERDKIPLDTKIETMDFSVRALNCLKAHDIEYLGQLVELSKNDLLKMRQLGKHTFTLIDEEVEKAGYEMSMRIGYVRPEDRK